MELDHAIGLRLVHRSLQSFEHIEEEIPMILAFEAVHIIVHLSLQNANVLVEDEFFPYLLHSMHVQFEFLHPHADLLHLKHMVSKPHAVLVDLRTHRFLEGELLDDLSPFLALAAGGAAEKLQFWEELIIADDGEGHGVQPVQSVAVGLGMGRGDLGVVGLKEEQQSEPVVAEQTFNQSASLV